MNEEQFDFLASSSFPPNDDEDTDDYRVIGNEGGVMKFGS